jgi:iron complex outermembrane receptor protein
MKLHTYYPFLIAGLVAFFSAANAQEQPVPTEDVDLYTLSLEELMNVPIVSASKKSETLFDAPLSSYTITRAEIDKAGSTSIMEALRLAPGVIVREQTNGVYDIHIRGFDNILRYSEDFTKSNLSTLVMIDNRPVFNHNLGGTFWEALPVDLIDVERIEIVRGPSAPLFGPNAVTGVINIITKRATEKTYLNATAQAGTNATTIFNGAGGSKVSEKFSFVISGNYQKRNRFDSKYYNPATGEYQNAEDFLAASEVRYSDTDLALEKFGANVFLNFKPTDGTSIDVSLGTQDSETQKNFLGTVEESPFTTTRTNSHYGNVSAKLHGLHLRGSIQAGKENLNVGDAPNRYDFTIADAVAEYELNFNSNFTLTPGLSYQFVKYNDKDYAEDGPAFLNGTSQEITTAAAFLRTDFKPVKNLRVIAALRADKFSSPDDVYLAYELATTYNINGKNLVRAAITRSNSGSFIGINKLNLVVPTPIPGVNVHRTGNENVDLFAVDMIEVGYRSQLSKSVQIDFDIFTQKADNYNALLTSEVLSPLPGVVIPTENQFKNVPTSARQVGATMSLNFVPNEKLQFKPFITVQQTETKDLASSQADPATMPGVTYSDSKHKNTPSFFGGYYFNFKATEKLNLNMNGYYFAAHRQYNLTDRANVSEAGDISGNFLVNVKVSYLVAKKVSLFINGRNLLNSATTEYWGTDKIGGLYMAGISFDMK